MMLRILVPREYQYMSPKFYRQAIQSVLKTNDTGETIQNMSQNATIKELVPNIVHYISFTHKGRKKPFIFIHYLSILSAHKNTMPENIYFHTDIPPDGVYWNLTLKIPEFKVVKRTPTRILFGKSINVDVFETTASDIDRLLILQEYGGIYLDLDVLIIRSFAPLLQYDSTIGWESRGMACAGIIVAKSSSRFIQLWLNEYVNDYQPRKWAYNSGNVSTS